MRYWGTSGLANSQMDLEVHIIATWNSEVALKRALLKVRAVVGTWVPIVHEGTDIINGLKLDADFEPRDDSPDRMFKSPKFSPCPGLILQRDDDPSSHNYISAPEIGTNIAMSQFDMTSCLLLKRKIVLLSTFASWKKGQVPAKKKFIFSMEGSF